MVFAVKGWSFIALLLTFQVSLAQESGRQICASQLAELGARPPDTEWLPGVWSVPLGKFLPFLATVEGVKDLNPTSFGYGPPGSNQREEAADPDYMISATCTGHLLFFTKNSGQYLVTVDLRQKKKLSGVGGLFGIPSQVWRVDDAVYAMNLYYSDTAYEGLILNVVTGNVLFYMGPSRYGDLKVALVVSRKGVLLENSYWGAPSARGSVSLSLFDLAHGARRQPYEEMPSCLVKLPPNAYEWRFTLRKEAIVLHTKTAKNEQLLAPTPLSIPTPVSTPPTTPPSSSTVPDLPLPTPPPSPPRTLDRPAPSPEIVADNVTSRRLANCHAVANKLLN